MGFEPTVTARPQCFSRAPIVHSGTSPRLVEQRSVISNQRSVSGTQLLKELLQQCNGFIFQNAGRDGNAMVELWFAQDIDNRTVCAKARIRPPYTNRASRA